MCQVIHYFLLDFKMCICKILFSYTRDLNLINIKSYCIMLLEGMIIIMPALWNMLLLMGVHYSFLNVKTHQSLLN